MKLLTTLFVILTVTVHAQTPADTAVAQIPQMLTPGKHLIRYLRPDPSAGLTPDQKALQAKVVSAFMANAAWMRDSLQLYSDPQAMADAIKRKIGLTEEEWNQYQSIAASSGKGYTIYGEDHLEIIANGKQINFHGTGSAQALDSVIVDLETNTVLYRQQRLPFTKIGRSGADNPFHRPMVGYQYELDKSSIPDIKNMQSMHMERYDFGVARFTDTGKISIYLIAISKNGTADLVGTNVALAILLD